MTNDDVDIRKTVISKTAVRRGIVTSVFRATENAGDHQRVAAIWQTRRGAEAACTRVYRTNPAVKSLRITLRNALPEQKFGTFPECVNESISAACSG